LELPPTDDSAKHEAVPVEANVVGWVRDDALVLDLRCLDDEAAFAEQLGGLD